MPPRGVPPEVLDACDRVAQLGIVRVGDVAAHEPEVGLRRGLLRLGRAHRPHAHRDGCCCQCQTSAPSHRPRQHRHSAIQMPCCWRYTSAAHEARMQSSSGMRLAA